MKIDAKGYITLTPKESYEIMDLLGTLEAMGGTYDQEFASACNKAGKYCNKILLLKFNHNDLDKD